MKERNLTENKCYGSSDYQDYQEIFLPVNEVKLEGTDDMVVVVGVMVVVVVEKRKTTTNFFKLKLRRSGHMT